MVTKQELLSLKEQIEKMERTITQNEGALGELLNQLKQLGFSSVEEAEGEMVKLQNEIALIENKLAEYTAQLEEILKK
jgi:septal ring factor EnvC (AmiA/AmiB activator)